MWVTTFYLFKTFIMNPVIIKSNVRILQKKP